MSWNSRRFLPVVLCIALAAVAWAYGDSYAGIARIWDTNSSFSHGFLIPPLCLWLAWRKREQLAATAFTPSWAGVLFALALVALWIVSRGAGVLGAEQFAVIALVPALVLATLGWQASRVLAFPLAFLMFAWPVGHALVPYLMEVTADIATVALKLTGIPVHRSNMYISVPAGDFEVARACSGLNYVITGLALGMLYSYLTYASWRKRVLSMAAFAFIPIFANGLRVYFTILISQLTDMRFGPGGEHVMFGKVLFVVVMLVMFWVGRRWQDAAPARSAVLPAASAGSPPLLATLALVPLFAGVLAGPPYLRAAMQRVQAALDGDMERVQMPAAASGWSGPDEDGRAWRPLYSGARFERAAAYTDPANAHVDAFVGVYAIGTSGDHEMISFGNRIFDTERKVLAEERMRDVALPGGGSLSVREHSVRDASGSHLVWHWFMVGERRYTDPYRVKLAEGIAFVTLDAVTERIVTLSTPVDGHEQARLLAFAGAHAGCIAAGFDAEACTQ